MAKASVVGACDTKGEELPYVKWLIEAAGIATALIELGTKSDFRGADVISQEVVSYHPDGANAVLRSTDRGQAVVRWRRRSRALSRRVAISAE
jgi:uncharacterized protein (UPF0261 family)